MCVVIFGCLWLCVGAGVRPETGNSLSREGEQVAARHAGLSRVPSAYESQTIQGTFTVGVSAPDRSGSAGLDRCR